MKFDHQNVSAMLASL